MKDLFINYLFTKHYFVSDTATDEEHSFEALFALAQNFNIKIVKGQSLASISHLKVAENGLGYKVPDSFYKNFPDSVWNLIQRHRATGVNLLLYDQVIHYVMTYGLRDFSNPGYSVFEEDFEKIAFKEETPIKEFSVLTEEEAVKILSEYADDLLNSTRPLNCEQFDLLLNFILDYGYEVRYCASKNTAIKLILSTKNAELSKFISLADIIALVDELNFKTYKNRQINKLNLKNEHRKLIAKFLDKKLSGNCADISQCFEKQAIWQGLLHHIHYKPTTELGKSFVKQIREGKNISAYSAFERAMQKGDINGAVNTLLSEKGSGALLRNLNYILSRCQTDEQVNFVLNNLQTNNPLILIQLLYSYKNYDGRRRRAFTFAKHNLLCLHEETAEEKKKRKSVILKKRRTQIAKILLQNLKNIYKNKLGKVFIDAGMENFALPLEESTSSTGYGTLAKGSKINMEQGKKIRAFTYWEKVNDIDLSIIGLDKKGNQTEFSWRNISTVSAEQKHDAIAFSGDQTSGYNGGSEFFDIQVENFIKEFPDIRYLVFCNNVYSGTPFSNCICKAGYMLRDIDESGMVFEPKTVKTSFTINCESTFAYLFAFDLKKSQFIWLNITGDSKNRIAGTSSIRFVMENFTATEVINLSSLFKMMATKVVKTPEEADIILSDNDIPVSSSQQIIRSYDFEKILALINNN
ncbi:MAG: hypothetical protein E7370_04620 [Clostridiales bacterium]|nr:hypothetical protein [Clostridiales bacterium]